MFEPTLTCTEKIFEETDRLNYLMKRKLQLDLKLEKLAILGIFWNLTEHAKTC